MAVTRRRKTGGWGEERQMYNTARLTGLRREACLYGLATIVWRMTSIRLPRVILTPTIILPAHISRLAKGDYL